MLFRMGVWVSVRRAMDTSTDGELHASVGWEGISGILPGPAK